MRFDGKAFKYGRDVNTDVIIPARYLNTSDPELLAHHCMEDLDPGFIAEVRQGDIIIAGENFGCGSSREHAPLAIRYAGVSCVVASSFGRIFFRNAINTGLAILECRDAVEHISAGDRVTVDTDTGRIVDETTGEEFEAEPLPPFIVEIVEAGGLVERARRMLAGNRAFDGDRADKATRAIEGRRMDEAMRACGGDDRAREGQTTEGRRWDHDEL